MRVVALILSILNLIVIAVCVVASIALGQNAEAVPTWEYLLIFPMIMTLLSIFLAGHPAVKNSTASLALLIFSMPPLSWLLLPMLFIKPSPQPPLPAQSSSSHLGASELP